MNRFVLALTVLPTAAFACSAAGLGLGGAARAAEFNEPQGTPPEVERSAAAYLSECESYESSPSPTGKFISAVDLSDDREPDYVIDTNEINASCFCGSGGCTIEAWVSEGGGHVMAFQSNVRAWQVTAKGAMPATLIVDLHGTACGGVGADVCLKALIYRNGKLVDSTADP